MHCAGFKLVYIYIYIKLEDKEKYYMAQLASLTKEKKAELWSYLIATFLDHDISQVWISLCKFLYLTCNIIHVKLEHINASKN